MSGSGFGADRFGWNDEALEELRRLRGWTEEAIETLELRFDARTGRVGFPIRDETLDNLGTLLYLPDPERRNGRRKMTQPTGIPRQLFPPPESLGDDVTDLVLPEGESDAVAAWSAGFAAVGVPGVGGWKPEYAARFTGRRLIVYVCGDCDNEGRDFADRAAASLVAAGVDARVIDLDPTRSDSYDLTDFLLEHGADALRELLDAAEPYTAPVPSLDDVDAVIIFVTGEEFVAHPVEQAVPIVVDAAGATAIPAIGLVIIFGDGGAGKTTLWLDGSMHFCAGIAWLGGLLTPTRALRVGWVENEGPQEEFRRKLERKLDAWRDRVPADRFHVLTHPWATLDLRRDDHRAGLAAAIRELELDLVIIGPLNDLGMEGGGTPDEVRAFHTYLKDVQRQADRAVSLVVLHHENTAGRISGAWTGRPDLLVHVTQQGHGQTRVFWQKAKWSSALHRTTNHLRWADGEGFELAAEEAARPERTWEGIAGYVLEHGGAGWNDVAAAVPGEKKYLQRRRDAMLEEGLLINAGTATRFRLWHRDDPARPTLGTIGSEVRTATEPSGSPTGGEGGIESGSAVRVRSSEPTAEPNRSEPPDQPEPVITWPESEAAIHELTGRTGQHVHEATDVIEEVRRMREEESS